MKISQYYITNMSTVSVCVSDVPKLVWQMTMIFIIVLVTLILYFTE